MDTEFNFLHVLAYCISRARPCALVSRCTGLPVWPRVTTLVSGLFYTRKILARVHHSSPLFHDSLSFSILCNGILRLFFSLPPPFLVHSFCWRAGRSFSLLYVTLLTEKRGREERLRERGRGRERGKSTLKRHFASVYICILSSLCARLTLHRVLFHSLQVKRPFFSSFFLLHFIYRVWD